MQYKKDLFTKTCEELSFYDYKWKDVETILTTTHQIEMQNGISDKRAYEDWASTLDWDVELKKDIILWAPTFTMTRWRQTGNWWIETRTDLFKDGPYWEGYPEEWQ